MHRLRKFADDSKLGGSVDLLKVRRLYRKIWTSWSNGLRLILSFNETKCKILPLGHNNPMQCYRLGKDWPVENNLKVLVISQMDMSQHSH